MAERMLRIVQVRSVIGRTQDQRATVRSLGLRRIRHEVLQPDRPEIRGMLRAVAHLVTFSEVEEGTATPPRRAGARARGPAAGSTPAADTGDSGGAS